MAAVFKIQAANLYHFWPCLTSQSNSIKCGPYIYITFRPGAADWYRYWHCYRGGRCIIGRGKCCVKGLITRRYLIKSDNNKAILLIINICDPYSTVTTADCLTYIKCSSRSVRTSMRLNLKVLRKMPYADSLHPCSLTWELNCLLISVE